MALQNCHTEHGYLRFVGYCNQEKLDLTKCFRAEVRKLDDPISLTRQRIERQDANRAKAKAKRERAKALEAEWRRLDPEDGLPPFEPRAPPPPGPPPARTSDPAARLV